MKVFRPGPLYFRNSAEGTDFDYIVNSLNSTDMKSITTLLLAILTTLICQGQIQISSHIIQEVEPQPLLAQAQRLAEALAYIGNPLSEKDIEQLKNLGREAFTEQTVREIQQILDPYCLAFVDINPEARVKVERGPAPAELIQEGWKSYLVKVHNQAGLTSALEVISPNANPLLHRSSSAHRMQEANALNAGQVASRFMEVMVYRDRPMNANLSGLKAEYVIVQLYTRAKGQREVKLNFHAGPGTEDIGFRNSLDILFAIKPSVKVNLRVRDDDGAPVMASFIFMDKIDRLRNQTAENPFPDDYRLLMARHQDWEGRKELRFTSEERIPAEKRLRGIYPLPARRLAWTDEYPDFFFQPQVYRTDGEHIFLPPGNYSVIYTRGPEYVEQRKEITIPAGQDSISFTFDLKRWIKMTDLSWYSGDHHIHAAGCSHYESPEEGVRPEHMWRQIQGEDLNFGSNLTWGPCWYYQKEYFTGEVHPLSNEQNLLRYDVEVSGFPSSHAGHIVLLDLTEDDYPNTTTIEEWPTWTLPVLKWAKAQGGLTGYAHSGWGLEPQSPTDQLPHYEVPKMDGIGANEYVVTVAHDAVDFYSLGDTPPIWELNMWYHTLNCGFRVRASGETDFPCISDEKVGRARIYAKLDKGLEFEDFMSAIARGESYISTGHAHLIDFQVNKRKLGEKESEIKVKKGSTLNISVKASSFLTEKQDEIGAVIAERQPVGSPFWHIEKARIGTSRKIPVELIVNGHSVETKEITADGNWNDLKFEYRIEKSSWIAIRVLGAAHTNPIFAIVDNQPVLERESAEWCLKAIDRCWEMKSPRFRESETEAAREAYDYAREVYRNMLR